VNLGTENRRKTMAAIVLGGLAILAIAYLVTSLSGGGSPQAAANAPIINPPTSAPPRPSRPNFRHPTGSADKKPPVPPSLDPTLKLTLLASSENMKYMGNGRNIFRAEEEIPKPIASPVQEAKQDNLPPPPPPPPPINLKFFGFASKAGEAKRIFLSKGEDVFIAGEGDIVDRRYKVVQIGPASVTIEDVLTNNTQQIPLTQG
jgi:hypothetical protein